MRPNRIPGLVVIKKTVGDDDLSCWIFRVGWQYDTNKPMAFIQSCLDFPI